MDIRPEIQIRSMIKAMIDVVLPAVDAHNKLAQEQSRLIIATLQLIAKRLPIAYRYDRDELERYVALAQELTEEFGPANAGPSATDLQRLAAQGADILKRAQAEPAELEEAIFELRDRVSALVGEIGAVQDTAVKARLRKVILAASKTELDRERALVVDMGFEADPANVPAPIEMQLPMVGQRHSRSGHAGECSIQETKT